jgi:hypothetical protein
MSTIFLFISIFILTMLILRYIEKTIFWIATKRNCREAIEHLNSFPDGTMLVPSKEEANRCVEQSAYGRSDGMLKEEFSLRLQKTYYELSIIKMILRDIKRDLLW